MLTWEEEEEKESADEIDWKPEGDESKLMRREEERTNNNMEMVH